MTATPDRALIARAARLLRGGGLVAFPTETVYGLGADATNAAALDRLFAVKGRPRSHPLIVHLGAATWLDDWARDVPDVARRLAARYWPGPLTLILDRAERVPRAVTGGQDTVGVRVPRHPVALALLEAFGGPIAAPSANRFGRVSPTTAAHVEADLGGDVDLVLDGGPCEVGIESTIVDVSRGDVVVLRPGHVTADEIAAAAGMPIGAGLADTPRAPGTLEAHYAPRTPLVLVEPASLVTRPQGGRLALYVFRPPAWALDDIVRVAPAAAGQYAHDLYAAIRELDRAGAERIIVEAPPATAEWSAVVDRLRRASRGSTGV